MTNTIILTLNQAYQSLKTIKTVDESIHSETAVDAVFSAVEAVQTAISKCTAQTTEDRAVKIQVLKDMFMFEHPSVDGELEKNQLAIIEQLAAE